MKVLHLTGEREDMGGITSVLRNLQSASQSWNWQHSVLVNRDYVELRRPALNYRYSRAVCSDSPSHFFILIQSLRAFFEIKRLLAQESFGIVHAHTRGTFLVALGLISALRRPVLFTNHSYARRVGMYRWAAARPGFHTVVLTPNMARHYGLAEQPPKVNVISACCSDRFFEEPLTEPSARSGQRSVRFVGVGNIMRWKNWHLIVQALAQMTESERPRIEFSHWGPTPGDLDSQRYDGELRRLVTEHRLQNQFLFRGPTQSVSDCLRQADWFVLPSTNEPCSVALIEALALGVPGLVSASGGNVDILRPEKTGLLFRPDDAADLAAKFRAILQTQVTPRPPAEIRESVRHRSAASVAAQYRVVYESLLAPVRSSP
jgi:glycosyltransferase involved in cell wall biosynthesis